MMGTASAPGKPASATKKMVEPSQAKRPKPTASTKTLGTIPGCLGSGKNNPVCDTGTVAMTNSNVPGASSNAASAAIAAPPVTPPYPKWTMADAAIWQLGPERFGGGVPYLFKYKDGWVSHNKEHIKKIAAENSLPADLLAGVAWAEVGGMPDVVDSIAYPVRSFDWSGSDQTDKAAVTKHPDLTSVGSVSIQLANVAKLMNIDLKKLSYSEKEELIKKMEIDASNLEIVAKYLVQLRKHDYPNSNTSELTDEQIIVIASRYNRGTARQLSDYIDSINAPEGEPIREYSSYGRALIRHRDQVKILLK